MAAVRMPCPEHSSYPTNQAGPESPNPHKSGSTIQLSGMRFSFPALLSGFALLAAASLAAPLPVQSSDSAAMVARETSAYDLEARAYFDDIFSYDERFFHDALDLEAREPVVDPTHFRIGIIIRPSESIPLLQPEF